MEPILAARTALEEADRTGDLAKCREALRTLAPLLIDADAHAEMESAAAVGYALAERSGDKGLRAIALLLEAQARLLRGDGTVVIDSLERCRKLARRAAEHRVEIQVLVLWGGNLIDIGRHEEASRRLASALRLARRHGMADLIPEILIGQGRIDLLHGRFQRAMALLDQAASASEGNDSHPTLHTRLNEQVGRIHLLTGDLARALGCFYRMAATAERAGSRRQLARALNCVSMVFRHSEDPMAALETAELALAQARSIGDRLMEASFLNNLGNALNAAGRTLDALEAYRGSLQSAREIGERSLEIASLENIGVALSGLGRISEAAIAYQESLTIAEEVGDKLGVARCRVGLGILALLERRFDHAIDDLLVGLSDAEAVGALSTIREAHEHLGRAYEERGEAEKAMIHIRKEGELRHRLIGAERLSEVMRLRMRDAIEKERREREALRERNRALEMEVEHQLQELNAMAVRLTQTGNLLHSLQRQMGANTTRSKEEIEEIVDRMRKAAQLDQEWEQFDRRLDQIHGGFLADLARRYPDLTPAELKVSALLRTQIGTKDIANLLNVGTRVVEKHRWNIRRKLGLGQGENLSAFLAK